MSQDLVEYFMRETDKKFDGLIRDVKDIKKDVQALVAFRLMLMGLSGFVAAIVTIVMEIYFK